MPDPPDGSRGPLVTFTFDGRAYDGFEGEPLAAALLAADRRVLSRSFRFHRPRGLMCSTGQCGWCECEVDGVPSVRSCRVGVHAGLVARGEHAVPSVERDLLAAVGLVSRWIPPTFYHHRFLRPRRLRKRYLDVLRWFGGRGRLAVGDGRAAPAGRPVRRIETDVLVVGGGRAGSSAAIGAARAGARVVLLEAEPAAVGGGWPVGAGPDDGLGTVAELATSAAAAGVEVLVGTTAIGWYDGMVAAVADDELIEVSAGAVVAATGSYDRVPLVPGNDRPGVMAARAVIELIERHGIVPGRRAVLVGDGRDLATVGVALRRAGIEVVAGPLPTASLVSIRGRDRVSGAVTRQGRLTERHPADLIVFADRSPNLDLVLAAGAVVGRQGATLVPITDEAGRTSVADLFVAGSATGRPPAAGTATDLAAGVGRAAADHATDRGRAPGSPSTLVAAAGPSSAPPTPAASVARGAMVCFCEDVRAWEIRAEQAAGYTDPELIKRRTGALTGPCQGKSCLQAFVSLCGDGSAAGLPTARPPLRPVRLGDLAGTAADATGDGGS